MARAERTSLVVSVAIASFVTLAGCDKETPSDEGSSGSSGQFLPPPGGDGSTARYTVDCMHPGAGRDLGGGRCECEVTFVIDGVWNGFYTCREGNACVDKDVPESFRFRQEGNTLTGEDPDGTVGFTFTGTICKEYFVWTGGPADKKYEECGTLRFIDANHYVKDSCYKNGGGCVPSWTIGCPDMTGQCTNTGSKKPEAPPPIVKMICK